MLKKMLWLLAYFASAIVSVSAQELQTQKMPVQKVLVQEVPMQGEVIFRFVVGNDMLFSPWSGNDDGLRRLSAFIKAHHATILSGDTPVRVYGYCASGGIPAVRLRRVRLMSNRVKSEMILHDGLREEHFRTENSTAPYGELRNVVIVRISVPHSVDAVADVPMTNDTTVADSVMVEVETVPALSASAQTAVVTDTPSVAPIALASPLSRWSVGATIGIPFFCGDMVSLSADKTYFGFGIGLQGGYSFSEVLGVSLSVDYARGKTGARDYSRDYELSPSGMTLYGNATDASLPYRALYSRISLVNIGLGLDMNLNRLFSKRVEQHRFTVWASPTVYGQMFDTSIRRVDGDSRFSDGNTKPATFSLGLGGAMSLRYRLSNSVSLQLKNSAIWITDNKFDGIVTPYGHTRHNLMWLPQVGVMFRLQ
ncbi:MAG: porin family protein [Bacteroides sp.]|nr:porin family protein [Bacteroides sp.]